MINGAATLGICPDLMSAHDGLPESLFNGQAKIARIIRMRLALGSVYPEAVLRLSVDR